MTQNLGGENKKGKIMLVRNLSRTLLKIKSFNGKKAVLPPMKVIELDELDFPPERVKKLFGKYVHILTEKATEDEVPAETKEDMGHKEDINPVQPTDAAVTEEKENETAGATDNVKNATGEDAANDNSDADAIVDAVLEEVEAEADKKEEPVETPKAKKATKKTTKKTAKK